MTKVWSGGTWVGDDTPSIMNDNQEWEEELRWWRSALAFRLRRNANIWLLGDSMTEGYGAPSLDKTWKWIFRQAIQQMYRNGGAGYIPAKVSGNGTGFVPDIDTSVGAPANAHKWQLGTQVNATTNYGYGFGRRGAILANPSTSTLIWYGTDLSLFFVGADNAATATVATDSQTGVVVSTQRTTAAYGRLTPVRHDIATQPLGWHTTTVVAGGTGNTVLDGALVNATDATQGVHVYDGGHSGYKATDFDIQDTTMGANGNDGLWTLVAEAGLRTTVAAVNGAITSGSSTFTGSGFTASDVGEWIFFDPGQTAKLSFGMAKIIGFTNSTTVTLDRVAAATATGLPWAISRDNAVSVSTSLAGGQSRTITVTAGTLTQLDVGKTIRGHASFPDGTWITSVADNGLSGTISAAVTSATTSAIRINNRESKHTGPDLLVIEFGINEMQGAAGPNGTAAVVTSTATFKQNIINIVNGARQRGLNPLASVLLLPLWAPGWTPASWPVLVGITNLSNTITLASDVGHFAPTDIGKTITGTGIPASTTITAVAANGLSATISNNATATNAALQAAIANRPSQDIHWQPYRTAMYEVARDQGYAIFDLYETGGWIGTDDPNRLTVDFTHASERGSQWIADRMNSLLTGMPRQASVPQGMADRAGEMLVGVGNDTFGKKPGILRKVTADLAQSATATWQDITEWQFYIGPNETLSFIFNIIFTSAAIGTGMNFRLNPAAGIANPVDLIMAHVAPTGTVNQAAFTGDNTGTLWTDFVATALGTHAAGAITLFQVVGGVTAGASGGLITPQFQTEVNASAATMQRGSWALIL